jgi:SAM-dependent methyltransferase
MHEASFEKMRAFRETYLARSDHRTLRVLDVGSGGNQGDLSYRDLFSPPRFDYVGLDIAEGPNVDVVPEDPYLWTTIGSERFDLVVSGQTFEHNPYFWITMAEIARVLTPGGLVVVIAPSTGRVHRFPFDCWRFYPDSWAALCSYVGLELMESYVERSSWRNILPGAEQWHDSMMIARKPNVGDDEAGRSFYDRLDAIVATRTALPVRADAERTLGPATMCYERVYQTTPLKTAAYTRTAAAVKMSVVRWSKVLAPGLTEPLRRQAVAGIRRASQKRSDALFRRSQRDGSVTAD